MLSLMLVVNQNQSGAILIAFIRKIKNGDKDIFAGYQLYGITLSNKMILARSYCFSKITKLQYYFAFFIK